MDISYYYL